MSSGLAKIDQKEYLKKYLSGDKKKDKKDKKKKTRVKAATVKIIDDDVVDEVIDVDADLMFGGEDAPQIVEIIDDWPEDVRNAGASVSKWKSVSSAVKEEPRDGESVDGRVEMVIKRERRDSDQSPVRIKSRRFEDNSPPRRRTRKDSDQSPPRTTTSRHDEDPSPPRRRTRKNSDQSPVRTNISRRDDDPSPPRRKARETHSPSSSGRKSKRSSVQSPTRKPQARDSSPPRSRRRDDDQSPVRIKIEDSSPPRRRNRFEASEVIVKQEPADDSSPPRKQKKNRWTDKSHSRDPSPPRRIPPKDVSSPAARTLDGKRAGLQSAKALKSETEALREREREHFENMSSDVSGRNAEVQVRKSSYKNRKFEKDKEKDKEKEAREKEKQEIYNRWGKGLKQIEDYRSRLADEQHESAKPLARYSDDADLDEMLKQQERAGDPMLEYLRSKEKEKKKSGTLEAVPVYKGPFPENRFNIRPGYRWDGLDRSNGFEKKWFDMQNQKKAAQEEAYLYSVEDM